MIRCPACGAHNPDTARWCGQCLRQFAPQHSRPDPPRGPAAGRSSSGGGTPPRFPAVPPVPVPDGVRAGAFLTEDGRIRWRCPACGEHNDLDDLECATCGAALAADDQPGVDWQRAKQRAALAPGLGHFAAGHAPGGLARLVLAGVWLLGALSLLVTGGVAGLAPAVPMLAGVTVLWFGAVIDLDRLSRGRPELVTPRVLLWLVVGVIVLVLLTVVAQAPLPLLRA